MFVIAWRYRRAAAGRFLNGVAPEGGPQALGAGIITHRETRPEIDLRPANFLQEG